MANFTDLSANDSGATSLATINANFDVLETTGTPQFAQLGLGKAKATGVVLAMKTLNASTLWGFKMENDNATNVPFGFYVTGDSQMRFDATATGVLEWGAGNASLDTNLYRSAANTLKTDDNLIVGAPGTSTGSVVTVDGTQTFTNKTITKRVASTTDNATATINGDTTDEYYLTAISSATTTISVTGTPTVGQTIFIGLKDAGVSKNLSWSGITALGVTLPTATTAGKQHIIGLKYIGSAWRAIAVGVEA